MGNFRITGPDAKGDLIMGGHLTVEHASDIRAKLIEAFTRSDRVRVSLDKDAEVDLAFLQILCSAHHTALSAEKTFEFDQGSSGKFREAVDLAGYTRIQGCVDDREKDCLWILREGK